jgi:hypothetical protein
MSASMIWQHGPFGRWEDRVPHNRRHEPFTPRVPEFFSEHPGLAGALLAAGGFFGNWLVGSRLAGWPAWMLLPGAILAVVCLVLMVVGLGLVTIRALYPLLAVMDLDWDAEPLAVLGIPLPLQRKCEQLGYWSAEDLVRAVERGRFPWVELEYDERMQVERATHRWSAAVAAERTQHRRGWRSALRRSSTRDGARHGQR